MHIIFVARMTECVVCAWCWHSNFDVVYNSTQNTYMHTYIEEQEERKEEFTHHIHTHRCSHALKV